MEVEEKQKSPKELLSEMLVKVPFGFIVELLLNQRGKSFDCETNDPFHAPNVEVDYKTAALLKMLDPSELFIHVQIPGDINLVKKLRRPLIWDKHLWDLSYERYKQQKPKSDLVRQQVDLRNSKIVELAKALIKEYGFFEDKALQISIHNVMKRYTRFCSIHGVDISLLDDNVTKNCTTCPGIEQYFKDLKG